MPDAIPHACIILSTQEAVDKIVTDNPSKWAQAKANPTMLGWFVGQVMRLTAGRANPQQVLDVLREKAGLV